ncbi:MAG TPA: two-component regulator propeller domain-containing protein [Ignavibacteriales bacterium]|nr:two-component regulator propeller domain-containing protein [Ignavibacteriales bacterium]
MKLLKTLFEADCRSSIKTLAISILLILPSILSGQDSTWKFYEYKTTLADPIKLDGDTLWLGSNIGLIKLNTVTFWEEFIKPDTIPGNVRGLEIDKQRNFWMGTSGKGLFRFDGKSWTIYNKNNSGMPDDDVNALSLDSQGNVWIGTNNGLVKFDGKEWKTFNTLNSGLLKNVIRVLCVDNSDNLWAEGNGKLYKFDGTSWKVFDGANWGYPNFSIKSIKADPDGKLWIDRGTPDIVFTFDGTTWGNFQLPDLGTNYSAAALDQKGNYFLHTFGGNFIYNNKTSPRTILCALAPQATSAAADSKGGIWVTDILKDVQSGPTAGHLERIGADNFVINRFNFSTSFSGRIVNDIALDQKGNTWFATNEGVSRFDGNKWSICHYLDPDPRFQTPAPVTAITAGRKGQVWAGTDFEGLYFYDGTVWKNFNKSNSGIKSDFVRAVAVDHDGYVWIATGSAGLIKYDGNNWVQYCPYNDIYSIAVDPKGVVWVGTDGGLFKFEGSNSTNFNLSNAGLPGNYIYSITFDQQNNIWFLAGTKSQYYLGGVSGYVKGYMIKYDGRSFSKIEVSGIKSDQQMTSVAVDEKGVVWAGNELGVFKYDGINWTQFNSSNSILRRGVIRKIIPDKHGNIWIIYYRDVQYDDGIYLYNENGIVYEWEGEGEINSYPKVYSLTQNYPNPFNPATNISYSIAVDQNVKLKVYDMLGKEVATLVDEYKSAGVHTVQFNASHLPSGVYIYTIQAGEFWDSKKLVLLK